MSATSSSTSGNAPKFNLPVLKLLTVKSLKKYLTADPDPASTSEIIEDSTAFLYVMDYVESTFASTLYARTGKSDPSTKDIWTALGLTSASAVLVDFVPLQQQFLNARFSPATDVPTVVEFEFYAKWCKPKTELTVAVGVDPFATSHPSYYAYLLVLTMDHISHESIKATRASFSAVPSKTLTETDVYKAFEAYLCGLPSQSKSFAASVTASTTQSTGTAKDKRKCSTCGGNNHSASRCFKTTPCDICNTLPAFLLDSGSALHLCNDRNRLINYHPYKPGTAPDVTCANDKKLPIQGYGTHVLVTLDIILLKLLLATNLSPSLAVQFHPTSAIVMLVYEPNLQNHLFPGLIQRQRFHWLLCMSTSLLMFTDESSNYTAGFLQHSKSALETLTSFKLFQSHLQAVTKHKILHLHGDGGGEFTG
ncbi:hypothetical protein HDU67_002050, partial [Dinochytrium kinnereticum]